MTGSLVWFWFPRIDIMQSNSQAAATKMGNKKRKYSNNSAASDTDSAIEADISLVRDEQCLSPDLGQVEEPKKTKTTPKLKQMSVQSFFGKSKSPALNQPVANNVKITSTAPKEPPGGNDVVVLDVKDKTISDSSNKKPKAKSPALKQPPANKSVAPNQPVANNGKSKSSAPKQPPGDNDILVLDVKDKSIPDSLNKKTKGKSPAPKLPPANNAKSKSPAPKHLDVDNDVVVLGVKEPKEEEEITVITVAAEKPKDKESAASTTVLDTSAEKKNRGPRYDTMVNKALEHLNTRGEGCSKLEILVYILRKFQPSGDIVAINEKLGKALDVRVKKGTLLSNEKVHKESIKPKEKFQKAVAINKKWIKKERSSPKTAKMKEPEKQKQKKEAPATATKPKVAEVQKTLILNPTLAIICEAKKLTKQEVGKKVWTYIKKHNLRDPKNKLIIRCDQNLKKLTKRKTIPSSSLMAAIKQSFIPV